MEISVNNSNNLPEGCILSIRAGSTRRQAPLPLAEPLRFPNLPFNAKNFKVDILSTLGTERLDIAAVDEVEKYRVQLNLKNGQQAEVGITVREEPSLCGKRAAELKQFDRSHRQCEDPVAATQAAASPVVSRMSPVSPPPTDKVKADTREYAREHNLAGVVQEMLQYVLRERPEAPYATMAAYLSRRSAESGEVASSEKGPPVAIQERPLPGAAPNIVDAERRALEARHASLRAQRLALLRELAEVEGQAVVSHAQR